MQEIDIYYIDNLAKRDQKLLNLESLIENKRAMLLEKQKNLKKSVKENEFLEMVRNDYQRYYNHIIGQKQDQIKAMNLLTDYVNDLIVTGKMTDEDIKKAKYDQIKLVEEMGTIKQSLEPLLSRV